MSRWRRCVSTGVESARPAPGVLEALRSADTIVIAPSNPIVSIGPILAVPGIRDELIAAGATDVVAVSPIVAGAALKGPADRLMADLGLESSVVGVARIYADVASTLVVDVADGGLVDAVEAERHALHRGRDRHEHAGDRGRARRDGDHERGLRERAPSESYRDVGRRGHRRGPAR